MFKLSNARDCKKIYKYDYIYNDLDVKIKNILFYNNETINSIDVFNSFKHSGSKIDLYTPLYYFDPKTFIKKTDIYLKDRIQSLMSNDNIKTMILHHNEIKYSDGESRPYFIDGSEMLKKILEFEIMSKKRGQSLYKSLNVQLSYMINNGLIPNNNESCNIFLFNDNFNGNMFIDYLDNEFHKDYENFKNLISKCKNIFIINPDLKLLIRLDLTLKNSSTLKNILYKFKGYNKKNIVESDDINIVDNVEDEPIVDRTANVIDTDNEIVETKKPEVTPDGENVLEHEKSDKSADVDLDEIISASKNDLYEDFNRMKIENEEFLKKLEDKQTKALKPLADLAKKNFTDSEIEHKIVDDSTIINENAKKSKTDTLAQSYMKKMFHKDLYEILKGLNNDNEHPVSVIDFKLEPTSDALNLKQTLTVKFADKKSKTHTFKVHVPILTRDNFLYVNGSKKSIVKQLMLLPIIKEAPDRVQITSNYKKCFVYRKGDKISQSVDRLYKMLVDKKLPNVIIRNGDTYDNNIVTDVSMAYAFISKHIIFAKIKNNILLFNQKLLKEQITNEHVDLYDKVFGKIYIPVGYVRDEKTSKITDVFCEKIDENRKMYNYNIKTKSFLANAEPEFVNFALKLVSNSSDEAASILNSLAKVKSLAYTEVKIAAMGVPLSVLIAFYKGFIPALELYNIKYRIEQKNVSVGLHEYKYKFKDLYVICDSEHDSAKELFLNGLMDLDTQEFAFTEAGVYGPIYIEYIGKYSGSRNTAKLLINFQVSMIDPITKSVLEDLKLPTNFEELLLLANTMLSNYMCDKKNDMGHFRVRDAEVINGVVYNVLQTAFLNYKRSAKSGVPAEIKVPEDAVLKEINKLINVESFTTLNPFASMTDKLKTTYKGLGGLNESSAFTLDIRAYDESMLGVLGQYSPIGPEIGVSRTMTHDPKINHVRGYLKSENNDPETMKQEELLSTGDLVNTFNVIHSDPNRAAMATIQSKHIVNVKRSHSNLVGTGIDKALAHVGDNDYAYKARDDGKVVKIDKDNELVILKYKDGSKSVIDISGKLAKNLSGFFTINKLSINDNIKVGATFKKNDILAYNNYYFKKLKGDKNSYNFGIGCLSKVAIMSLDNTFEDSGVVTTRIQKDMQSEILLERDCLLKANSKISFIAKVGDIVNVNDPLVKYEVIGDEEDSSIKKLEKLDPTSGMLSDLAQSISKAKYAGEIYDIKIFYNADFEKMHPTLLKVVKDYISKYRKKTEAFDGMNNDEFVEIPSLEKIESDKIMGKTIEGVMIRFYIKHYDDLKVGDKLTFYSACKAIIAEVIPKGLEPYSEYRKEDEVSAFLSPMSLIARLINDVFYNGFTNKLLLELKWQCLEELGIKYEHVGRPDGNNNNFEEDIHLSQ